MSIINPDHEVRPLSRDTGRSRFSRVVKGSNPGSASFAFGVGGTSASNKRPSSDLTASHITILYNIKQGFSVAAGHGVPSDDSFSGIEGWANFFNTAEVSPGAVPSLKKLWGQAERASTEAGLAVATQHHTGPDVGEQLVLSGAWSFQERLIQGSGPGLIGGLIDEVAALESGAAYFGGGLQYDPRHDRTAIYLEANYLYHGT